MDHVDPVLFALGGTRDFGERVAQALGTALAEHEERAFEDGEHKARPLVSVRGRHTFAIQSLYSDADQSVNDKLCRLLFFVGALRDASAASVTAIVPYLGYARKDRRTQPRDPVTTRYVAQLIEAVGTDCVITLDVHNLAAYQNAFRCRTVHLEAMPLFVEHLTPVLTEAPRVVVVSPDAGGVKRADLFRKALERVTGRELDSAYMEKARSGGVLWSGRLLGEVSDAAVVIVDDLIATGGTLLQAGRACREAGASHVYAIASHGVFTGAADRLLSDAAFDQVVVTDTIPPFRLDPALARKKLAVLSAAGLFAQAIRG
jgi:ribose-phosphate pyrophosphokinase